MRKNSLNVASGAVSGATIGRMPAYLRYLKEEQSKGIKYVSSAFVAKEMDVSAILVRKDFSLVSSSSGKPRLGFEVECLINDIEKFLGYDNATDAIVVGTGGLGCAFLGYEGFKNHGMNIVAGFDVNPDMIGKNISGKTVYSVDELGEFIQKNNVNIGIITTPKSAAQKISDVLVESGIKAIWNFAPLQLSVPAGIELKNEDLAASLALLSSKLVANEL